jgi:hypothetical protein
MLNLRPTAIKIDPYLNVDAGELFSISRSRNGNEANMENDSMLLSHLLMANLQHLRLAQS